VECRQKVLFWLYGVLNQRFRRIVEFCLGNLRQFQQKRRPETRVRVDFEESAKRADDSPCRPALLLLSTEHPAFSASFI
jgi:hypothetical protein